MCTCNDNGLGALAAGFGLRGITDPIHKNARFSLGVEIVGLYRIDDLFADPEAIRTALINSGYVSVNTQVYQRAGIINPYIVVEGGSGREYGSAMHLRDAVLSVIQSMHRIDAGTVSFEADTYNPQTQAPTVARYDAATGGAVYAPVSSDSFSGIFDQLAASLGVTRTQAVMIGAGGAIVGLILLKRLI